MTADTTIHIESELVESRYHCVGCGSRIGWDGTGLFCYTCSCGATLFAKDDGGMALPASLVMAINEKREPHHLDYYLGKSAHVSDEKTRAIGDLRKLGSIWSWQCLKCRHRTVERAKIEIEHGLYRYLVHPDLQALVKDAQV